MDFEGLEVNQTRTRLLQNESLQRNLEVTPAELHHAPQVLPGGEKEIDSGNDILEKPSLQNPSKTSTFRRR